MSAFQNRLLLSGTLAVSAALAAASAAGAAETPVRGGELNFVVGSTIPSYDGHQETTFGMIHPIRPFYSLLIRINPDNPQSTTDFICDLCEGKWQEAADRKSYTFKIRENVKFHDGTPLTAADIKASLDKIIFPPELTGNELVGALSDMGGPLEIAGNVRLSPDRSYLIEGSVAPRPEADKSMTDSLQILGAPDAQGRRPFSLSGTM